MELGAIKAEKGVLILRYFICIDTQMVWSICVSKQVYRSELICPTKQFWLFLILVNVIFRFTVHSFKSSPKGCICLKLRRASGLSLALLHRSKLLP